MYLAQFKNWERKKLGSFSIEAEINDRKRLLVAETINGENRMEGNKIR